MLWLLEDALWPVVCRYIQHWVLSCFIWGVTHHLGRRGCGDELQISRTNGFMARTDSFNLSFTSTMLAYLHHLLITINPESRLKRLGFTGRCCAVLCAAVVGKQRRQSSCCHTTWSLLPHSPSIHWVIVLCIFLPALLWSPSNLVLQSLHDFLFSFHLFISWMVRETPRW